jgi:hypothetical protein
MLAGKAAAHWSNIPNRWHVNSSQKNTLQCCAGCRPHLPALALALQVLHDGHGVAVGPLDAPQQRGALPEAGQVLVHHAHNHGQERMALGHLNLEIGVTTAVQHNRQEYEDTVADSKTTLVMHSC